MLPHSRKALCTTRCQQYYYIYNVDWWKATGVKEPHHDSIDLHSHDNSNPSYNVVQSVNMETFDPIQTKLLLKVTI